METGSNGVKSSRDVEVVAKAERRRFLRILGLSAGVSVAGAVLAQRQGIGITSIRSRIDRALDPGLKDAPQGVLNEAAVRALLATTEALVGTEIERSHYEIFFRWRAENLPGYRDLYERFTAVVDHTAKEEHEANFAGCDMQARRKILQSMTSRRYARVFGREGMRFYKYIIHQILALFSATDAWILLGYESWPGTPRGLDSYTRAPRTA